MIEVKNLVKKYGNHTAVDHLNFTIEEGHVYGFLGPNGAGKSTTMNIMTGYLGATEGEVLINGHDILKEPEEAKKQIGYLPELPPLYMEMTVREYLEFVAELKGIAKNKREESINEVEKMVKIWEVENRLIRNLSKGYRQRVGLAQAVLGYPPIIILDEPTAGLDPKGRDQIFHEIAQYHGKTGSTILLVSHSMEDVAKYAKHVLVINDAGVIIRMAAAGISCFGRSAQGVKIMNLDEGVKVIGLAVADPDEEEPSDEGESAEQNEAE